MGRRSMSRNLSFMMRRSMDLPRSLLVTVIVMGFYIIYLHTLDNCDWDLDWRVASPEGAMKITVMSMNTEEAPFNYLSLTNKIAYAKKHHYDFKFDLEGNGFWHKLDMVEQVIKEEKSDWMFWIDFDTLITNSTIKVEDIINETLAAHKNPDKVDMIFTPDCFPLNAGVMIYRNHPRLLDFVHRVKKCGERSNHPSDQDCILEVVQANKRGEKDRVVFIKQWKMNAFPAEIPCYEDDDGRKWEPGMFVLHVAGAWAHMPEDKENAKNILLQKYAKDIV